MESLIRMNIIVGWHFTKDEKQTIFADRNKICGEGSRMPQYRAYAAGHDGRLVGLGVFVCANDGEAIERAKCLLYSPDIELWCGDRLVTGSKAGVSRRRADLRII